MERRCDYDAPPLKLAHCIHDAAYGDLKRHRDLKALMKSSDPAYRETFEACYWIEPKKRGRQGKHSAPTILGCEHHGISLFKGQREPFIHVALAIDRVNKHMGR